MRTIVGLSLTFALSAFACAQPPEDTPVIFSEPFESISGSVADETLVLIVISNDVPNLDQPESDDAAKRQPIWCESVITQSYLQALDQRADLRSQLKLQSIAAGVPVELTGGENRNVPARLVTLICDGHYRLLSFVIGVPDGSELLTMIEDTEETRTLRRLHADQPEKLIAALAARSGPRMGRMWQTSFQEIITAYTEDLSDEDAETTSLQPNELQSIAETFEPIYLNDVRLRFGLEDVSDRVRLVVLEQHQQARHAWCQAMIPLIADADLKAIWQPLVELVWGHQPVTRGAAEELLQFYDSLIKTDPLILSLQSPLLLRRNPWPPTADKLSKGVGWADFHTAAQKLPYREIDLQQLAILQQERDLPVMDVFQPSRMRYLLFQPRKKPTVAHEGDPPGRFMGLLK
jgi:hypothetical protein